jgi:hypothetical protein
MTAKANSFGQRTFDFIEGLDRLDTPEAVLGTMLRVVSRFGFEWLAFTGILPKPGETLDDLILAHHSPDGLHDLYANRDYVRIDPNMRRALQPATLRLSQRPSFLPGAPCREPVPRQPDA